MNNLKTPSWVDNLIDNLAPLHLAEEIRGDLYELFLNDVRLKGIGAAKRNYVFNGLGFLIKSFFWKKSDSGNRIMFRSYFKMAKSSLLANKSTSFINLAGLIIAIAATLVLIAVIQFELSFDKFHSNADNIYRVVRVSGADKSEYRTGVSFPVHRSMRDEIPSLHKIVAMEYFEGANVDILDPTGTSIKKFREESGFAVVEPTFFEVFDFKDTNFRWIHGNPERALLEPFNAVLTKSIAEKYFGDENPVGQTIKLQQKFDCKITGVITDLPKNTDFPFTVLISYASVPTLVREETYNSWFSVNDSHNVFVALEPGTTKEEMERNIAKVHAAHTPKEIHESRHYLLQELGDLHHDVRFRNYNGRTISMTTILALKVIAIFLLLTGSINYINLSTAQSSLRAKEIGLRKVMGGNQKQVLLQFLIETFVLVFFASAVAFGLAEFIILNIHSLLKIEIVHSPLELKFLGWLILIMMVVTLIAGLYPSLVLSRFNPVTALKSKFATEKAGGVSLRKVLVVVQFSITQILVVGTFIVVSQMDFFQDVNMGFNKDGIITARIPQKDPAKLQTMENKLRQQPYVKDVSFSYTLPSGITRNRSYADIGRPEATELKDFIIYEFVSIDPSFLELYGIKLLAGRNLTELDSTSNIIINKTLIKNLRLGTPEEAVGKELKFNDGTKLNIVGVIDDYYGNSLKEQADNVVMLIDPPSYSTVSVKLDLSAGGPSLQNSIDGFGKIWSSTFPDFLFSYQFFDENIAAFYEQEQKYSNLFKTFSALFLFIGCLGLYGLITFLVNRKSKEVAVRKVLGATMANILMLFSREYIQLIVISFLIAIPVTYYFSHDWLNNFANHIELKWWYFAIPGIAVLLLSIFVVTLKSFRAATANPVEKLKYE